MANARTAMRRQFAKSALTETYLKNLQARAEAGELPPQVEVLLLHYLLGKPTEEIEHSMGNTDLMDASTEELLAAARQIEAQLAERVAVDQQGSAAVPPTPVDSTPSGSVH